MPGLKAWLSFIIIICFWIPSSAFCFDNTGTHNSNNKENKDKEKQGSHTKEDPHKEDANADHGWAKPLPPDFASAKGTYRANFLMCLPFLLLLMCIATLPLMHKTMRWWEENKNRLKVALGLALTSIKVRGVTLYRFVPLLVAYLVRKVTGDTVEPEEAPHLAPQFALDIRDAEGRPLVYQEQSRR